MNAEPLGRVTLRVDRATVAIDPGLHHGSAHTGADSLGIGQIKWPFQRRARRIEEHGSQRKTSRSM